jgi:cell division protein FtsN
LNTAPVIFAAKPVAPIKSTVQDRGKAVSDQRAKPFTILASTFSKLRNAEMSAAILTRQGFNATITYSEPYYRVCVGAYTGKNSPEARNDLLRVKSFYKDAMFKLR